MTLSTLFTYAKCATSLIHRMNCRAAPFICENLATWGAKGTYTVHAGEIFENENIDLHLLKACQTPTIQTVTEHRTASTEYLNGYVTVQHRSFRKPSFLDPRSSISETRVSILASRDSILASQNLKQSSFEMRGSSLEFPASSVNLLLSGTGQISVQRKWKRKEIFAVGLVNSVLNLPDGQVIFGGEFKHRRTVINPAHQIFLGWLKWLSG